MGREELWSCSSESREKRGAGREGERRLGGESLTVVTGACTGSYKCGFKTHHTAQQIQMGITTRWAAVENERAGQGMRETERIRVMGGNGGGRRVMNEVLSCVCVCLRSASWGVDASQLCAC